MPRKEATTGPISAQAQQDLVSEGIENFELPKSIVTKIARSAIPENAKLQKDTVLALVKGSTVFINYLAATAHDVALSKQHRSISGSDVLKAIQMLEFEDIHTILEEEMKVYREVQQTTSKSKPSVRPNLYLSGNPAKTARERKERNAAADEAVSAAKSSKSVKGKEKETPSPFTSTPLPPSSKQLLGESISSASGVVPMEVDDGESQDATPLDSGDEEGEEPLEEEGDIEEDDDIAEVQLDEGDNIDEGDNVDEGDSD